MWAPVNSGGQIAGSLSYDKDVEGTENSGSSTSNVNARSNVNQVICTLMMSVMLKAVLEDQFNM